MVHPDALDPMNGAGQTSIYQSEENPDGFFDCEYNPRHAGPGVISMANQGPNTNGSQFMIEPRAHPFFDHLHTVFGVLYEGSTGPTSRGTLRHADERLRGGRRADRTRAHY